MGGKKHIFSGKHLLLGISFAVASLFEGAHEQPVLFLLYFSLRTFSHFLLEHIMNKTFHQDHTSRLASLILNDTFLASQF
jgi:hypothetical protein